MNSGRVETHWLTHASFSPKPRHPHWLRWWPLAAAAALLLVLASWGPVGRLFVSAAEVAAAREQQQLLAAEAERLRTELAVESATRAELEQHSAELNSQVAELTRQLEFLKTRKPAVARAN